MKIKTGCLILMLMISVFGLSTDVSGRSLKVSPASYSWKFLRVDSKQEMPETITVFNDSDKTKDYGVKVKRLNSLNAEEEKGYKELPDLSWVSFEPDKFEVAPGEKKKVKVFLEIQGIELLTGTSWMFYAEVRENPGKSETIALACYPRILLSLQEERKNK